MFKRFLKELDILISIILTLLCIPLVLYWQLNETPVRLVLGSILVAFLPGYSLITALFPRRDDLGVIERVALSFGLSISIVTLLGLILYYSPFGIKLIPVLIVLSTFTISLSFFAWFRRLRLPVEERFRVPLERLFRAEEFLGGTHWDKVLSIILIISIIASSAALVYIIAKPETAERVTEFYLLGPNGEASDYPTDLKVGEEGKVIIGIVNHEYENLTYRLEVIFNGSLIHEEHMFLIENEKWEIPFTFKVTERGKNQKLEFLLYKNQNREVYITLHLWIRVNI